MKMKIKLNSVLKTCREYFSRTSFRKTLPLLYAKIVFLGFALTGMQVSFWPKLVICSRMFGDYACDPLGNYVVAVTSIPGYLFTGKIMSYVPMAPAWVFFMLLFLISFFVYYLLGLLIDKRRGKKLDLKGLIVFMVFAALLVLLAMLFALI